MRKMSCHHIFIFVGQIPSYQTITCFRWQHERVFSPRHNSFFHKDQVYCIQFPTFCNRDYKIILVAKLIPTFCNNSYRKYIQIHLEKNIWFRFFIHNFSCPTQSMLFQNICCNIENRSGHLWNDFASRIPYVFSLDEKTQNHFKNANKKCWQILFQWQGRGNYLETPWNVFNIKVECAQKFLGCRI